MSRDRTDGAADRWASALRARAIPEQILRAAPESPWGFPAELFRARAERTREHAADSSADVALEVLPEGGSVLDVGCGSGAATIPLARRAATVVGVDPSDTLLTSFAEVLAATGTTVRSVLGSWPDVARVVPTADVVVCHHVLYNVPDVLPFVDALTDHARRRVVVEVTGEHPLAWMEDLWERFHDLDMPPGPDADDLVEVLRARGLAVTRRDRERNPSGGFAHRDDAVALVRRRLCLPSARDAEIADALGPRLTERDGLWSAGPGEQTIVTLWWSGTA